MKIEVSPQNPPENQKNSPSVNYKLDISCDVSDRRGESKNVESILTPTPSSVRKGKQSAVARAIRGQFLTEIRPDMMYCTEKGKSDSNGKRKFNFNEDIDN